MAQSLRRCCAAGVPRGQAAALGLGVALAATAAMTRAYGTRTGLRFAGGMLGALLVQHAALSQLMSRSSVARVSSADLLTLSRGTAGSLLAGLATAGVRDPLGTQGRLGFLAVIWGGISDTLDGRLARRLGVSGIGKTLDIESDSWLNLWSAASGASWAGLPRWSLLPPIFRYVHPLLDLCEGRMSVGGGPWWSRLAGGAQNIFLFLALAPAGGHRRNRAVQLAWLPVAIGQILALGVALARRVGPGAGEASTAAAVSSEGGSA